LTVAGCVQTNRDTWTEAEPSCTGKPSFQPGALTPARIRDVTPDKELADPDRINAPQSVALGPVSSRSVAVGKRRDEPRRMGFQSTTVRVFLL
jgi:hypothetical protein